MSELNNIDIYGNVGYPSGYIEPCTKTITGEITGDITNEVTTPITEKITELEIKALTLGDIIFIIIAFLGLIFVIRKYNG